MRKRGNKGQSLIDFPEEYVCIDTETTGLDFESDEIIEISAIHVKQGEIIDKFVSLLKPHKSKDVLTISGIKEMGYESFEDLTLEIYYDWARTHLIPDTIQSITGITNEMLLDAPYCEEVMPNFLKFIGNQILVGHNVNFDVNFLYDSCRQINMFLKNDFVDTMRIARKIFPELEHHRLSDIADFLNIEQEVAHRAEADTITTIKCFEKMRQCILQEMSIETFRSIHDPSYQSTPCYTSIRFQPLKINEIEPTVLKTNPDHPFFGKIVVFTGELSISRETAAQIAVNSGAILRSSVSRKTDFLVVGIQDEDIVGPSGMSSKQRKAHELNQSGKANIEFLSEQQFMEMYKMFPPQGNFDLMGAWL